MNEKRLKAAANQAVIYRNYRRARERALTRLAQAHPEIYKEMLEQEKANDEQLGKKWLDLDGTTAISQLDSQSATTSTPTRETSNRGENESHNGGEA